MHDNAAGKAMKERLVVGRLLSLCLQHMFKDQPWLLQVSGETRSVARNSQAYRSNVPSVNSAHISTHTDATQTLLTWEL